MKKVISWSGIVISAVFISYFRGSVYAGSTNKIQLLEKIGEIKETFLSNKDNYFSRTHLNSPYYPRFKNSM